MKLRFLVIFAALFVFASISMAGSGEPTAVVKVPFAFRVDDAVLPAGQYLVTYNEYRTIVMFRQLDGKVGAYAPIACTQESGEWRSELVFDRYGDRYVLRQLWIPGARGAEFFPSKVEKERRSVVRIAGQTGAVATTSNP